jgi:hypothetical protein
VLIAVTRGRLGYEHYHPEDETAEAGSRPER